MPVEDVPMDDNMRQAIENLRQKHHMLLDEDVVGTLISAAIEQERRPSEGAESCQTR